MSEPKQFLIVDDAEENVVFLSQILEDHGYQFRVANNGKDDLEAMRQQRPDLVLLDIMMPRKSGMSVFTEMKTDDALKTIPVIFISGASDVTGVDIQTGDSREAGDSDEFAKRFGLRRQDPVGFDPQAVRSGISVRGWRQLSASCGSCLSS